MITLALCTILAFSQLILKMYTVHRYIYAEEFTGYEVINSESSFQCKSTSAFVVWSFLNEITSISSDAEAICL